MITVSTAAVAREARDSYTHGMSHPRFSLRTLLIVVAVAAVISLAGAAIHHEYVRVTHVLTSEELRAVKIGMTPEEVRAILGKPTGTEEKNGRTIWTYGLFDTFIEFENGKCVSVEQS